MKAYTASAVEMLEFTGPVGQPQCPKSDRRVLEKETKEEERDSAVDKGAGMSWLGKGLGLQCTQHWMDST